MIKKQKVKRFKDFATSIEIPSIHSSVDWTMDDVFKMLDYLAKEIEDIKSDIIKDGDIVRLIKN